MKLKDIYDTWVYKHDLDELEKMYREDLRVNRHKLEVASAQQATVFEKWYSASEDVEGDLRDALSEMALLRSTVGLEVRGLHDEWKEGAISAGIEKDERIVRLGKRINMIRRYLGKLKGATESARQRKSMIVALKDLYIANYWDKTTEAGTPLHPRRHMRKRGSADEDE
jgi:hypothetical protein